MLSNNKSLARKINHIILVLAAIVTVYPILWTCISSFKKDQEIFSMPWSLPTVVKYQNYYVAWVKGKLGMGFFNSVYISITTVAIVVVVSIFASYALAIVKNKVTKFIFILFIVAIMVPPDVLFLTTYFQMRDFHLINNSWGVILPSVALGIPLSVFILTNFIKEIPQALIDSGTIDGCSRFKILTKIIIPLMAAPSGAVVIFQFTSIWNSFMLPLVILRKDNLKVLPLILSSFIGQYTIQYGELFAAIMITFLPVLIIFILFQKQFMQGVTQGAIKG